MPRYCSKCSLTKELSEFYQRKTHRVGEYYERCKDCFKKRGRLYYHQNHNRQLELTKIRKERYRIERKKWLTKIKNKPCADCGIIYPPHVMDFDHRDGDTKIRSISWLAFHDTANFDRIIAEIEKCDLVCANCHRIRTYDRLQKNKNAAVAKMVKAEV